MLSTPAVYLFTDIADSTRLWERDPERMGAALAEHDALVAQAVDGHRGRRVKGTGDGVHAVFAEAADALTACVQLQLALDAAGRRSGWPLWVRCGVHQGLDQRRDGDFFGTEVNRAARLMGAAHGGQVLVSDAVARALGAALPAGLGLQPLGTLRLRGLARPEPVHQLLAPGLPAQFPALRALEAPPHNLPQALNRFVGRTQELAELQALAATHRLVTLCGPGGIGKSRLLLQWAHARLDAHPDGVWWLELAPLREAAQIAPAVAAVLGVKEEPVQSVTEALLRHVRDRQLLLVLDNCEHVLVGAAALAKALLQAGPGVALAASSRELLRMAGECAWAVPPLAVPPVLAPGAPGAPVVPETWQALQSLDAVQLFVDRAQAANPAWQLDAATAPAVAEICRRLDGIPLALELAAARLRALPVSELAERLRSGFALLSTRDETVAPRQRTLRLLIDWSHDLLADDERRLWRRLSVFAGGWTLAQAEAVCADAALPADQLIEGLGALVDKSLVVAEPARGRWHLLETMRQYAAGRLAEAEQAGDDDALALRLRHAAAYRTLAETARRQLASRSAAGWLARLDTERDNLAQALAFAARHAEGGGTGLALCAALWPHWLHRGLVSQALAATLAALAHPQAQAADVARARALFDAGQMCNCLGHWAQARGHLEQALALLRALGDEERAADVLPPLGLALMGQGDSAAAGLCFGEALDAERRLGRPHKRAIALTRLALWHRSQERLDAAEPLFEEALAMARSDGDEAAEATTLLNLAMVQLSRGHIRGSAALTARAWLLAQHNGAQLLHLAVLDLACGLAVALGDGATARGWQAAAERLRARTGLQRDPADAAFLAPWLLRLEQLSAEPGQASAMAPDSGVGLDGDAAMAPWLAAVGDGRP
ncbi:ATP-binding protein [Aquabacterium sp. OR-4]|uniref:ATP-binding protein n=1 Tax=Aquabacterium sp. OR-4 TaxID=2978127 RepID=UPI0021B3611C|nr:tetratricopeptide repeat protein [Aquabacterium sp. OR-4]MDT7835698.1 tetratricopeptide repeat protein [Aquabacterium sp. OR-4]